MSSPEAGPPFLGPWWSWVPLPLLALLLAATWIADLQSISEAPRLLLILNLTFSTLVALLVAAISGRSFLSRGETGPLLLGCGVLTWGLCSGLAAFSLSSHGPNFTVTVHNLGVLAFSLLQLGGIVAAGRDHRLPGQARWLAAGCGAALGLTALIVWSAARGWIPPFFVQGVGGTLLRQGVLGTAIGMLLLASALLWRSHRLAPSRFAYCYSQGLALLGLGLVGVLLQASAGSPLGWIGRTAQYLGGIYLLVGVLGRPFSTGEWNLPIGNLLPKGLEGRGLLSSLQDPSPRNLFLRFGTAALASAAAFGIYLGLTLWVGPGLPTYLTFYPAVMLVAILAGPGPGMLATLLAILLVHQWILPPRGGETSPERLGMVLFLCLGVILSFFADLYRRNRRKAAIYDQEQTFRELRKHNDFLAKVLERASVPFVVGYPDGRLGLFNQAFADLTGYLPGELRNLGSSTALTPPEWRETERQKLQELERSGQPVRYEKDYLTKAGQRIPVELLVQLVRDADGRPDYFFAFITDISERKRAQDLLHRYELLAHHTRDIVLFIERDTGRILEANLAAETAYGYARAELLRLSIQELRTPSTRPLTQEQMAQADAQGILFETTHQRKDGTAFPVEVSSQGTTIGGVKTLLSVVRDISVRRHWEEALQESEATVRAILDATQESIWLFDLNGRILSANRTALKRVRKRLEEMVGLPFSRFIDPKVAAARSECLAQVVATRLPRRLEDERDGIIFDHTFYPVFDTQGRVHRVASFSRDITEARRADAALKRANTQVSLLAQSASDLLRTEQPAGVIEKLCRQLMAFLDCQECLTYLATADAPGFRLEVQVGLPVADAPAWLPREESEALDGWIAQRQARGAYAHVQHVLKAEDPPLGLLVFGTWKRAGFSTEDLALVQSLADQISQALQRARSKERLQHLNTELGASNLRLEQRVTERTQELQTRMLQLQALASQLNRAEEQERQRIAQVIHDHLQQLLVAARLSVDTLAIRTRGTLTEKSLKALTDILSESIQVARSLTAELYPSVLHRDGLAAALKWLAGWYRQQHGLEVKVMVESDSELAQPEIRTMLFRAVRELLFNVVKHAGAGSAEVRLGREDPDTVRIEVSDPGVGFDPEALQHSEPARTGFGLFSLRERMELFGGRLDIQSSPGRGSCFILLAPAVLPPLSRVPPALPGAMRPAPGPTRKVRILLADDHAVVREGLVQVLREEPDFEVVGQAANGQEALEEARRLNPDVVVLDVAMPVMDGIEATRRILTELPQVKVLGLSMYDDEAHAESMLQAGAAAFLDKGGPIATMKATIRRYGIPD